MNTKQTVEQKGAARIYGHGEMAELIREFDWSTTALGPISGWSPELVMAANMVLASKAIATLYWGPDQLMIYNDPYKPQLGIRHPALGKPLREVWSEVYEAVKPLILPPFETGVATVAERIPLQVLQDGRFIEKVYTVDNTPVRGETPEGSTVLGVLQTATDYTQAVQAERRLQASEAQASRVLQSIGDAVIVTDADARIIRMNAVAEQLTGWTSDEARQRLLPDVFRIVNETTRQPVEDPADKVERVGGVAGLADHTVLLTKDGREIAIDDSVAPILNGAGGQAGTVLVFRDIAERRAAEIDRDRLFGERNRFFTLAESSQDFIGMCDLQGNPFYGNPAARKLVGVDSPEQFNDTNLMEFFFPEDRVLLTKSFLPKVVRDKHAQLEIRFRHLKTGDGIPMSYQVFLLEDENGKPFGSGP